MKPGPRAVIGIIIILTVFFVNGCGESSLHSRYTDQPYLSIAEPKLVLSDEHFGGGYIVENNKKTFFAGGKLSNYGKEDALNVRLRIRLADQKGPSRDIEIFLGDVRSHSEITFEKVYIVSPLEKIYEIIMTYQFADRIYTFPLDPKTEFIEDHDMRVY